MFSPLHLKRITLPNRVVRAATFENMADSSGKPTSAFTKLYLNLARGGVKTIITGFNFTSWEGRAMQPFQAGIDDDNKVEAWKHVVEPIKKEFPDIKLIIQVSHAGRQTISKMTGGPVRGAGPIKCTYFRSRVKPFSTDEVRRKVDEYISAAKRAQAAGFDAVQIHAAHGYLIHQFLSPHTNQRSDQYGSDRLLFLKQIIAGVHGETSIPVLLKVSGADDRQRGLNLPLILSYWPQIDGLKVDAVEVSYGMMETAFNIIRGGHPLEPVLKHNPLFNRYFSLQQWLFKHFIFHWYKRSFIAYSDLYNLENAGKIKAISKTPILVTGGIRTRAQIGTILQDRKVDGVTLCRPFVCEPDLLNRFKTDNRTRSRCTSCNLCTVMCDSKNPLRCYQSSSK